MIKKIKIFFLTLITFFGCKKTDELGYKKYIIKKSKHRSTLSYKVSREDFIDFDVIFNESSIYQTQDPLNQADINKLYGVSDCGRHHMEYSIRFGWRYYNNNLELLWFKHEAGTFSYGLIQNIEINKSYNCSIEITEDDYILCVDGNCKSTPRMCSINYKRYFLYPYFGGDEKAPHDIEIRIK